MENNKIYITLLAVFLFIFVGTSLTLYLSKKNPAENQLAATVQNQLPVPTVMPQVGAILLQLPDGATKFRVGTPVTIQVLADSHNEGIVGWDMLLDYDTTAADFVGASSALPDFKIYSYRRANWLTLTSIQSLSSKTPSVFTGKVIATLTFRPKKAGNLIITIKAAEGNEKTDLVTAQTKALYPQLNSVMLTVE